jgi:hypothetical protein
MKKFNSKDARDRLFKIFSLYDDQSDLKKDEPIIFNALLNTISSWHDNNEAKKEIKFLEDFNKLFENSSLKKETPTSFSFFPFFLEVLAYTVIYRKKMENKGSFAGFFMKRNIKENGIEPNKDDINILINIIKKKSREWFKTKESKAIVESLLLIIKITEECFHEDSILPETLKIWDRYIW